MQKKSENFVWRIKRNYDRTFKNQASTIKTIEKNLGRIAELIHGRRIGTLPSFTEMNPKGLAHAITTRSGLNYQPPKNHLEDSNNLQNATTEYIIDLFVVDNIKEILPQNHDNSIEPILDHLPAVHGDCNNLALFAANSIDEEKSTPKLKELPSHLEYAFLDDNRELPIIISSLLFD
ncbi:hypothetical protein Tco_1292035 [Tanacetum coccineum]